MEKVILLPYPIAQSSEEIKVKVQQEDFRQEKVSWWVRILRLFLIPFFNLLPSRLGTVVFVLFVGEGGDTRRVRKNVPTYRALEVMYSYTERKGKGQTTFSDDFWENILYNARSIRSRLALVKRELRKAILELNKERVNLLSLGSGSARAVIEVLYNLRGTPSVEAQLIDISRQAIAFSQQLAGENGIASQMSWFRDHAQNLDQYCKEWHPDIIEMVGLLDYYPDDQALDLLSKIYHHLAPNGCLITCNIRNNFERPFVTKGIGWPLIYRSPQELAELVVNAGFKPSNVRLLYEPYGIHGLAIARKAR